MAQRSNNITLSFIFSDWLHSTTSMIRCYKITQAMCIWHIQAVLINHFKGSRINLQNVTGIWTNIMSYFGFIWTSLENYYIKVTKAVEEATIFLGQVWSEIAKVPSQIEELTITFIPTMKGPCRKKLTLMNVNFTMPL